MGRFGKGDLKINQCRYSYPWCGDWPASLSSFHFVLFSAVSVPGEGHSEDLEKRVHHLEVSVKLTQYFFFQNRR